MCLMLKRQHNAHHRFEPPIFQTAKLCLCSNWGKLCQRGNMGNTTFFKDPEAFFNLVLASDTQVNDIHIIDENIVQVRHSKKSEFEEELPNTNVAVGAYVTSYGRLELYSYLEQLQERLIYCDTDSCLFLGPRDIAKEVIKTGDALGQLTDELAPGEFITKFVSGGPKVYSYITNTGRTSVTVKGIRLNQRNSNIVTFDLMKEMVLAEGRECVEMVEPYFITRTLKTATIETVPRKKKFRMVYTKRRILPDGINTVPFGYKE